MSFAKISRRLFAGCLLAMVLLAPSRAAAQSLTALHRFFNSSNNDFLFTANYGEGSGWTYQGVSCYVYNGEASGTVPVYRYYNAGSHHHFLTSNYGELGGGSGGFTYEGIAFYVLSTQQLGSVPLHRWYLTGTGKHFYTTSNTNISGGTYEGVIGYVSPS